MNVKTHLLGFPRVGKRRELKKALEEYWKGKTPLEKLQKTANEIKKYNWEKQSVLDYITVGDFSFYDHILDTSLLFGNIPERFHNTGITDYYETMFAIARGVEVEGETISASPMTKWFNTNYHYIAPETNNKTSFTLKPETLLKDIELAKKTGKKIKVVIPGPVTYLWLGTHSYPDELSGGVLNELCKSYQELFQLLSLEGIEWVQVDEPAAALDSLDDKWKTAIKKTWVFFMALTERPKLMLSSYFVSPLDTAKFVSSIPADGYHLDLTGDGSPRSRCEVTDKLDYLEKLFPKKAVLSLGLIDGRNVWKTDISELQEIIEACIGLSDREVWLSSSCSMLHLPYTTGIEKNIQSDVCGMLCFAEEKITELVMLKTACGSGIESIQEYMNDYRSKYENYQAFILKNKVSSEKTVRTPRSESSVRIAKQSAALELPVLPITTIGSFPQTSAVRKMRSQYKKGRIDISEYNAFIREQICELITWQEEAGIDVLVHGEFERNDMVEYFCEAFDGFVTSDYGWVQSYGSRCVKPAIVCCDIKRPAPVTVDWITYAQSLTDKPVKGMLTGPVSIIKWCFPRCDISFKEQVFQTAEAVNAEVCDLEEAGIKIIQIDEAAFREAQPLSRHEREEYDSWAPESFRICSSGIKDETQIHTHMCYSEFATIMKAVKNMDADVLTIEASRSEMAILEPFSSVKGFNQFGPGIYDIHSPEVPSVGILKSRIEKAHGYLGKERLWVNPDCGLKTRNWPETEKALANMVAATNSVRDSLSEAIKR